MPHVEILLVDEVVQMLQAVNEQAIEVEGAVFRIDPPGDYDDDRVKKLIDTYRVGTFPHLCVRETVLDPSTGTETNPHYHGFMFIKKRGHNALRGALVRLWPGQKGYCLKKNNPKLTPSYFNYMCKGTGTGSNDKPQVLYHSEHITEEVITQLNAVFWKNKADIKVNCKKRKRSVHEEILEMCQSRGYTDQNKTEVAELIVQYWHKRIKYLNESYVTNVFWQTLVYLSPHGPVKARLIDRMMQCPYLK